MKKVIKKNYKFILGIIIGLIWSSGIAYAATILFDSDEVSYDNTTSGLSATNVQSALDELYVESTSYQLFESRVSSIESKLYSVGTYYETSDSSFDPNTTLGGTWTSETIKDDYIVEEGTSGIWTYRKWNSGIAECWGSANNTANWSAWGSGVDVLVGKFTYPTNLFNNGPAVTVGTTTSWGGSVAETSGGTNEETPQIWAYKEGSESGAAIGYAHIHAIGTWKTYTAPSTIYRWHRTA